MNTSIQSAFNNPYALMSQSANTRDALGVVAESNAAAMSYSSLASALSNETAISSKVSQARQLGQQMVINLRDIKADSKLANMSPEAAAAAGLVIVDPDGNIVVGSGQQGYSNFAPQQQQFAPQQAPQQSQAMANQQQMMMLMQQLQQMQAQLNQSNIPPLYSNNNFSGSVSAIDAWGNVANYDTSNLMGSDPNGGYTPADTWSPEQIQAMYQMMMMQQGGMGGQNNPQMMPQQQGMNSYAQPFNNFMGYQQAPQAPLTLGSLKTQIIGANTVVNIPKPQQGMSSTAKMAMQMSQSSLGSLNSSGSDDSISF